jgi:CelD/BcsL family acetyltransferase involved in cellulose biosynthesis
VFASGVFRAFHDDLLAHYAQHGRLWLVGLRQGQNLIAARYLIEARGWLFDYISGLGATDDNLLNPGLALHMLTIDCAAAAGVKIYDFMGGDYDYKRRMALVEAEQDAVDLIRGNLRGRAWVSARAARRWLQQRRRRWSGRNAATAEASKTDPPKGDPDKANDAPGRLDNPDLLG